MKSVLQYLMVFWFGQGWAQTVPPPSAGAEAAVPRLQLTPAFINGLAEEARTNYPGLRAAMARVRSAEANLASVRVWEDPMLMLGGMTAERMMRQEDGDLIHGVEQKLPLFGKPKAAKAAVQAEIAVEQANYDAAFQRLRQTIATATFRVALADELVEIGEQDQLWLEALVKATENRYRLSEASQVELLRVQTDLAKRRDQLTTDRTSREHAAVALNRLLNRPLESRWPRLLLPPLAGPVAFNPKLVSLALTYEPKLKVLGQQVKQSEAAVESTKRQRRPDVSLGIEGRQYSGDGELRQGMFLVRVNLPWLNAPKYRQDIAREKEKLEASRLDQAGYALEVREEIHRLTIRLDALRREALLYRDDVIPRAEQALKSARAAWETNQGMVRDAFRDVLDARRMLLEGRVMFARAVAEQYEMLAELVLCCGLGDLEALQMIGTLPAESEVKSP